MVQEVTSRTWFSRLGNAITGVFIGILLIVASLVLVFWNESSGLHMSQSLEQAEKILVSVPSSPISLDNNMKVVYFTGLATTSEMLRDPVLDVSAVALKLERKVEMYQWEEDVETTTENEAGGSVTETKTYKYKQVWSEKLIDSSGFREQTGHQNPRHMPISSASLTSQAVTVGDFHLPEWLVNQVTEKKLYDFSSVDLASFAERTKLKVQHDGESIYIGDNPYTPVVGDIKISVYIYPPQTVSVIAQQFNTTLQAYVAPAGKTIALLVSGEESPQKMIMDAQSENRMMMWIWRAVSLMMIVIGIALILNPLAVFADVLPVVGKLVGLGVGLVALIGGLALWLLAVSIAWITVRPLMAVVVIVVIAGGCYWIFWRKK